MKNYGFTLIELLVTLAVVAIVATIAVPSFQSFVQNNRLAAQNNALITSLNIARSEAVKRLGTGQLVTVCASSNGTSCNTTQWDSGWLVFIDSDADATYTVGTGACTKDANGRPTEDCLVQMTGALDGGNTLRSSGFANAGFVQFTSRGALNSSGTFTLCDRRGAVKARAVNINRTGRASQATDSNGNSIVENMQGADVSCP